MLVRLMFVTMISVLAFSTATIHAEVASPWVTTDRTIDCSSYETILKGVIKDGMTDEQKSIAMFNFFRQRVYHYLNIEQSRDPLMTVNVIGNTLCGSQGTCMKGLLAAAGIKARVVSHPGHTFYEAFYDGQWHGFDTFTNLYIFTRGDKPHIASFEELNQDPTLISDAVKDKRCPEGMCPCGDDPMAFKDKISVNDYEPLKLNWGVKNYGLRNGEEIVRGWWPDTHSLPGTFDPKHGPGPIHTCGTHDRSDNPELYRFWEPYGIPRLGPNTTISYRHFFTGYMNYAPNLTTSDYKDGKNVDSGVQPSPTGLTGPGTLTVPVNCSFYITGSTVAFEATCAADGDAVEVSGSLDGKTWTPIVTGSDKSQKRYLGDLAKLVVKSGAGLHEYQVKFELKGKAVLNHFYMRTNFQHNAMATPHLMPGKNVITLEVKNADALAKTPLSVIYRYKEAPDWKGEIKTVEHSFSGAPLTFEATLPETKKLPQMQDLTLRCGTLSWDPAAERKVKVIADFSTTKSTDGWTADKAMNLSHDGEGLLLSVEQESKVVQASLALKDDWKGYKQVIVEYEILSTQKQNVALRVTSNEKNEETAEIVLPAPAGKGALEYPTLSMLKTKLGAVTKLSVALQNVPKDGCKLRIRRIILVPGADL